MVLTVKNTEKVTQDHNFKGSCCNSPTLLSFDVLLTFEEILEDGETQSHLNTKLKIESSERSQLNKLMQTISGFCIKHDLPLNKLAKISTCADWNFWETETGNQANFIKATNGKIYFGNRQDLNDFEKAWMKFGFGANVQCMNTDEWVEYVISKVSSDTPSRHHIEV
jgi:hypothetical protein